jgi:hypothetical protein
MIAKKLLARDLHLEREKSRHFKNIQIHSFVKTGRCYKPTGSFLIDDFSFSVVHRGEALNGPM